MTADHDPPDDQDRTGPNITEIRAAARQARGHQWINRIRQQLVDGLPPTNHLPDEENP